MSLRLPGVRFLLYGSQKFYPAIWEVTPFLGETVCPGKTCSIICRVTSWESRLRALHINWAAMAPQYYLGRCGLTEFLMATVYTTVMAEISFFPLPSLDILELELGLRKSSLWTYWTIQLMPFIMCGDQPASDSSCRRTLWVDSSYK